MFWLDFAVVVEGLGLPRAQDQLRAPDRSGSWGESCDFIRQREKRHDKALAETRGSDCRSFVLYQRAVRHIFRTGEPFYDSHPLCFEIMFEIIKAAERNDAEIHPNPVRVIGMSNRFWVSTQNPLQCSLGHIARISKAGVSCDRSFSSQTRRRGFVGPRLSCYARLSL